MSRGHVFTLPTLEHILNESLNFPHWAQFPVSMLTSFRALPLNSNPKKCHYLCTIYSTYLKMISF